MQRKIFDEDHESFRKTIRQFIEAEVVPHYEEWYAAGLVPREVAEWTPRLTLRGASANNLRGVDLALPGRQGELLERVLQTGTPTVLLLVTGRPYALGDYAARCVAIVQAFMPGVEGAEALADVLCEPCRG